jgi:hypothetical protein
MIFAGKLGVSATYEPSAPPFVYVAITHDSPDMHRLKQPLQSTDDLMSACMYAMLPGSAVAVCRREGP